MSSLVSTALNKLVDHGVRMGGGLVGAAGCVGSVGKWLVGGENVSGASWGWLFGSWSCWARPASAGACKPNHLALQIGGRLPDDPHQQELVERRKSVDLGCLGS